MSYGISLGKVNYALLLFSDLNSFSENRLVNLTSAIRQINIRYNIKGDFNILVDINATLYNDYLAPDKLKDYPSGLITIGGAGVQKRTRLLSVVSTERVVDPLTKFTTVQIEFAPYEYTRCPKFSRRIDGSVYDVLSHMYDSVFIDAYSSYKPSINTDGFSTSTKIYNLLQRQSILDYCHELRNNVISDNNLSPLFVWNTFGELNVSDLDSIIEQEPVDVILKSTDVLNQFAAQNYTLPNGKPLYHATSYTSQVDFDVAKHEYAQNTMFFLPDVDSGNLNVLRNFSHEDILAYQVIPAFGANRDIAYLRAGAAKAISSNFREALTSSMSTITVYYPDVPFEPGVIINLKGTTEKPDVSIKYLVVETKIETNNSTGVQTITLVKLDTVLSLKELYSDGNYLNMTQNKGPQNEKA